MKTLIVDDERHVIDAILLMIPWAEYAISEQFTASSVEEACVLLDRERPEIAFVDVVIGEASGSEILNHIKTANLPTKVITISGHDNYQYVRAMFLLGSIDYLLKPLEMEDVLRSLQKAINLIREPSAPADKEFEIDKMGKYLFPDRQHGLLRELFLDEMRSTAYSELCKINQRVADATECLVLSSDGMLLPLHINSYPLELSRFLNDLQTKLGTDNCGTLFQRGRSAPDIVILLYAEFDRMLALIKETCQTFNAHSPRPLQFGCSQPSPFAIGITSACRQAETASNFIDGKITDIIIPYTTRMHVTSRSFDMRLENQIFSAFLVGDQNKMDGALHAWLYSAAAAVLRNCGGLHQIWRAFFALYENLRNYFALQSVDSGRNQDHEDSMFSTLYNQDWDKTIREIERYFSSKLIAMQNEIIRPKMGQDIIQQIALFLQLNYSQLIRQQDCASLFHLSKEYMSRSFKKKYGVSMMAYLNQIRMEHAKELLANTGMTYQEIADAVGIFDNKYFARQFKQKMGLTPADYRRQFHDRQFSPVESKGDGG